MITLEREFDPEERDANRALFPKHWKDSATAGTQPLVYELNPPGWDGRRARTFLREHGEDEWLCVQPIDDLLVLYAPEAVGLAQPLAIFAFAFEVSQRPNGRTPIRAGEGFGESNWTSTICG